MKKIDVKKLAAVLRIMVIVLLVCNLLALTLVPMLVALTPLRTVESMLTAFKVVTGMEEMSDIYFPFTFGLVLCWIGVWEEPYTAMLAAFLLFCGVCTAVILWQAKRVLDTILKEVPFCGENAGNLKRAAVCCFLISGFALVRLVWSLIYFQSIKPLVSYNALFVPIFLMAGLLCMVMSALFRQAAELKEENDLTI